MRLILLLGASLMLLAGCSSGKVEQPISKQEATTFAQTIENDIQRKDYTTMGRVVDINLLTDEIMKVADIKNRSSFKEGVKEGWGKNGFSTQIIKSLGKTGTYELVKVYEKNGHQHIVFRLYGDDGLNYHDFELVKYADKISAKDIFIYITGENISKTMAQLYTTAMEETSANGASAFSRYSKAVVTIRNLYNQKDYETAKAEYEDLPESLQNEKALQLIYLQITASIGGDIYRQALNKFEKLFSKDSSAQLALFDVYYSKGDYDKVLGVIDNIDVRLQDPLLNYYRGLVYFQKNESSTAIRYLEKLYAAMPNFQDGALELLANYLVVEKYREADILIAQYKQNTTFDQSKLSDIRKLYPGSIERVAW